MATLPPAWRISPAPRAGCNFLAGMVISLFAIPAAVESNPWREPAHFHENAYT